MAAQLLTSNSQGQRGIINENRWARTGDYECRNSKNQHDWKIARTGPEFVESMPITREYEGRLYHHYSRPPYWLHEVEDKSAFSMSGA